MNNTETMCERCTEVPAEILIEHVLYGEAICRACERDEDRSHDDGLMTWEEYVYGEER